jgi:hypothetical protein
MIMSDPESGPGFIATIPGTMAVVFKTIQL